MIWLRHVLLIAAIWFTVTSAWAKPTPDVFRITNNGSLPDSFWRFKAGDSLAWASSAYNDARWEKEVSPTSPIGQNEPLWNSGRG